MAHVIEADDGVVDRERRPAAGASRTPRPASRGQRGARAPPARAFAFRAASPRSPSHPRFRANKNPRPHFGTRARGATRSRSAIAGGPSASAVTERPLVTEGFRAPLSVLRGAVSRDPFAPSPPPGLPPHPGSLSASRGLIAPARATFKGIVARTAPRRTWDPSPLHGEWGRARRQIRLEDV